MAGMAAIIVKLMPLSPQTDLREIEKKARHIMEKHHAKNITFEIKDLAFGLKSLHMKMACPEEIGTDIIEVELARIPNVSSVTIEDYRRAFG